MDESSFHWTLVDGQDSESGYVAEATANERVADNISDDGDEFVILPEPTDSASFEVSSSISKLDDDDQENYHQENNDQENSDQEDSNLQPVRTVVEALSAREPGEIGNSQLADGRGSEEVQEIASAGGRAFGEGPAGTQGPRVGIDDVLLNDEVIDEDNYNGAQDVIEVLGDDHENGDDMNVIQVAEGIAVGGGVQCPVPSPCPAGLIEQQETSGITFLCFALVIGYVALCMTQRQTPMPKSESAGPQWNHLTQCPQTSNPSMFIDHAVGTSGSWKSKHDALQLDYNALKSLLYAYEKTIEELKENAVFQKGRAEMFLDQYVTLKNSVEEKLLQPDWATCWNKVGQAAQGKLDGVPTVVKYLDKTVQEGASLLKAMGWNVTERLRQTFLNTVNKFTEPSTPEWNEEEAGKWEPDIKKEDSVHQSGGSVPKHPSYETMSNQEQQERIVITGVTDEAPTSEEGEAEEQDDDEDTDGFVSDLKDDLVEEITDIKDDLVEEITEDHDDTYTDVGANPEYDWSQEDVMPGEGHVFCGKKKRAGRHHFHKGGHKKKKKGCGKRGKGRHKKKNRQSVRDAKRSKNRKLHRKFR